MPKSVIFPAARVVVAIAAEIINAGMIWRRLFAFIQQFKPSARRKVAEYVGNASSHQEFPHKKRRGHLELRDCTHRYTQVRIIHRRKLPAVQLDPDLLRNKRREGELARKTGTRPEFPKKTLQQS